MVSIASRSSWGARRPNGGANLSGLAQDVVLHHTVTAHPSAGLSVAGERQIMRQLEDIGHSRFGSGISYNVLVFPSGRAYQGVSFNRRGTHTGGRNSTVRSICFVGNYEANQPTKAQLETAAAVVAEGRGKWWRNAARVQGHRDYSSTACPGKNVYSKRSQIASGKVTGGGTGGGGGGRTYESADAKHEVGSRVMGLYDGGTDVRWLQEKLGVTADGLYGPNTEKAVRAYQRDRGLGIDGLAGPQTIGALKGGQNPAPKPPSTPKPSGPNLAVDGKWGSGTTTALQRLLGTPVDGVVSRQPNAFKAQNPGLLSGWQWTSNPGKSNVIVALQKRLGVTADGRVGPNTISALQRKLGTPVDGKVSNPSVMVRKLQQNLNSGKLW